MKIFKKIFTVYVTFLLLLQTALAKPDGKETVEINCYGLPGCVDKEKNDPSLGYVGGNSNIGAEYILEIIRVMLQYVSVVAVIALMLSGFLYLLSGGEEEKTKKAKSWIIWSLVGVLVSLSSNFLVTTVINFNFN